MRLLERLKTDFTYRAYEGKQENLKDGKHTGLHQATYADAVAMRGHIGPPAGVVQARMFGQETRYTHVLLVDDPKTIIAESGLIDWNGKSYEVLAVRPTQNYVSVALRERTGSENG